MPETVLEKTMHAGERFAGSMREVSRAKAAVAGCVEDGMDAARRAIRRSRDTAEDLVDEAIHGVKRYPLQTVALTFAVAFGAGMLLGWIVSRK